MYNQIDSFAYHNKAFFQKLGTDADLSIQFDATTNLPVEFYDFDNNLIYSVKSQNFGENQVLNINLSSYPNLHNRCFYIFIQDVNDNIVSEPISCNDIHKESLLKFEYWNNEKFDEVVFGNGSFKHIKYIESYFLEQTFEEEVKTYKKSNGSTIKLASRLLAKNNLKIGYVPKYFHLANALLFMHDNILINGVEYVKTEGYEIEYQQNYGLATAKTVLTKTVFNYLNSNC